MDHCNLRRKSKYEAGNITNISFIDEDFFLWLSNQSLTFCEFGHSALLSSWFFACARTNSCEFSAKHIQPRTYCPIWDVNALMVVLILSPDASPSPAVTCNIAVCVASAFVSCCGIFLGWPFFNGEMPTNPLLTVVWIVVGFNCLSDAWWRRVLFSRLHIASAPYPFFPELGPFWFWWSSAVAILKAAL